MTAPLRVVLQRICACGSVIASQELPGDFPAPAPYVHHQIARRFQDWLQGASFGRDHFDPTLRIDRVCRDKCEACQ